VGLIKRLPFEWQIALRYTRAGRRSGRTGFVSFISLVSIAGIALGVAALIVVLSVMNGFKKDVTGRMLSVLSHIEVFDVRAVMPQWRDVAEQALLHPEVRAAAPFVELPGMLLQQDVMRPALIRGILPEYEAKVSDVMASVRSGSFGQLSAGSNNLVLGIELARALQVKVGDRIALALAPPPLARSNMMPQLRQLNVVGMFEVGHNEFDSGLAFMHLDDASALAKVAGPAGLRLRTEDLTQAPRVAAQLRTRLGEAYVLRDWTEQNTIWFAALQSQKRMMFIILVLIVAVAAFNVVAMLVMTVTDKRADIAILRTLGARPASIIHVFMAQGMLAGALGIASGVAGGVLVALNMRVIASSLEQLFDMQFLSKSIYFISAVPSDLHWDDVLQVALVALALTLLATVYPSWSASRIKPAQALRHE
jgi:lipoprotein-releasing system permease protein